MTARGRRKPTAIDDPLLTGGRPAKPAPSAKRTAALYVELPIEQWGALATAAFELRTHKRTLIAALIARYVDATTEECRERMAQLVASHPGIGA
jgi:hypothetical protein